MSRAALDAVMAQGRTAVPNETGGLLIGYRTGPREVVIKDVLGPGPGSRHRHDSFAPDGSWQAAELARRYEQSGRRIEYLGDWHTHPGGTASLSRRDRKTLRVIAGHEEARCPRPLMAVLAGGDPWRLVAYQLEPGRLGRVVLVAFDVKPYDQVTN